jgi:hypothetical protein
MAPPAKPDYFEYLGIAIFMLGGAWGLIKWVGHTIRGQLGPGVNRADEPFLPAHVDNIPPALVKDAIAHGLVTSAQLAGMTPMERQFVLAAMKDKVAVPRAINAAEFGMTSMPASDTLRVHCPLCGDPLELPAFAPFVGHCKRCGAKTVVRQEEGGRYVLSVAPR